MENYILKVKASFYYYPTKVEVDVAIPNDVWNKELDLIQEELEPAIKEAESMGVDAEYFKDSFCYTDYEDNSYECNPVQSRMASMLLYCDVRIGDILYYNELMETVRDKMVKELEKDLPWTEQEIKLLKNVKDFRKEMTYDYLMAEWGQWNNENQVCLIHDAYPLDMLDELAKRLGLL
jgi:hypothetical protein